MVIIIIVVNTMKSAVQLLLLFSLVIAAVSYRTSLSIHNRVTTQLQQQLLQPKSPQHRTNTAIKSYYDDEPKGLSPKILGILAVGVIGLFGSDIFGTIGRTVQQTAVQSKNPKELKSKSVEGSRGAKTRMTKREINDKLLRVPLFYASPDGRAIYVADGIGKFFLEKEDADQLVKSVPGLKVVLTSADQVYYPLIAKKQKLGSFIEGVAGVADPKATYKIIPNSVDYQLTDTKWKEAHPDDVPLFRVANLAFSKEEGLEIPLFTHRADALDAYSKLLESGNKKNLPTNPEVQVTSLYTILNLFGTGGFESRSIEFYPSVTSFEAASNLLEVN